MALYRAEPAAAYDAPERAVLVIDAGHGGEDGGAVSSGGLRESGVNLDIAKRLEALAGLFGVETVMTRATEEIEYPPELGSTAKRKTWDQKRRLTLINSRENAVLISIHQNKYPSAGPSGAQTFFAPTPGSRELAEIMQADLVSALDASNRRVATPIPDSIYLMKNVRCTAVLAECGFLSNPKETALLETEAYRLKAAVAIMAAYIKYAQEIGDENQDDVFLH